jgi:hypothetical protein
MAEPATLDRLLKQVAAQVRRRRVEHYGLRGAFWGAVAGLVPLVAKGAVGEAAPLAALGLLVLGALGGMVAALVLASPRADIARLTDRAFGLEDRISTALEWADRPDRTPLVDALVRDVTERVQRLRVRPVVLRVLPREVRFLAAPLVAGVALALLPDLPLPGSRLPDFSPDAEEPVHTDQGGQLQAQDTRAREEPVRPGELTERDFVKPVGGGVAQAAERPALFKDTALGGERPDFASFVKKGDDRLKLLEHSSRLPDLQADYTRNETRAVMQQSKALTADFKSDSKSEERLKELLEQIQKLGQKASGDEASHTASEGLRALQQGQQHRAIDAMNRALNALRESDDNRKGALNLRGGRQGEAGRQSEESGESREQGDPNQDEPGAQKGKLAGTGPSNDPKGDPTPRLDAKTFDTMVEGEQREGQRDSVEAPLYGQAAGVPSRLADTGAYEQYRRMMEDAIAREQVPRDYQSQVKDYFRAIGGK